MALPAAAQSLDPATIQKLMEQVRQSGGNLPSLPTGGLLPPQDHGAVLDASRAQGAADEALPIGRARELPEEMALRAAKARAELIALRRPSAVEEDYRRRLADPMLSQFGYELFASERLASRTPMTGQASDAYRLGVGDELIVSLQGAHNATHRLRVDREGRLIVPQLRPLAAAGQPLAAVRAALAAEVRRTFLGTEMHLSLGALRAISLFVGGEVERPGAVTLSSLDDIVAALAAAGGIKRTGSLRRVQLVREGTRRTVDLYGLLGLGPVPAIMLRDGDRLIVPVLGDTVAITGAVARPGIFELAGPTSLDHLVAYAGGAVRGRGARLALARLDAQGREHFIAEAALGTMVQPGDAVRVLDGSAGGVHGRVMLMGHVANPGPRAISAAPTLRALIGPREGLLADSWLAAAVLIRRDPATGARLYQPVDLIGLYSRGEDLALRDEDRLVLIGPEEIDFLQSTAVRQVVLGRPAGECRALGLLARRVAEADVPRFAAVLRGSFVNERGGRAALLATGGFDLEAGVRSPEQLGAPPAAVSCPSLFEQEPALLEVLLDMGVSIGGGVRRPGFYPVGGQIRLADLLTLAGGTLPGAGEAAIVSHGSTPAQRRVRLDDSWVQPGEAVHVGGAAAVFEPGAVLLSGEVARPGLYTIARGETLGQLLARAGGLTRQAYPDGAVFTRRATRLQQEEAARRTARDLHMALLTMAARSTSSSGGMSPAVLTAAAPLIASLTAVDLPGRMVVEADPAVLAARPERDIVLEAGDTLYIPKQPVSVMVLGDVLMPGAFRQAGAKSVADYLDEAGGVARSGDKGRVYLVRPDGTAMPLARGAWQRTANLPPGSALFVPKRLDPLLALGIIRDITGILASVASTVATLAIVARE